MSNQADNQNISNQAKQLIQQTQPKSQLLVVVQNKSNPFLSPNNTNLFLQANNPNPITLFPKSQASGGLFGNTQQKNSNSFNGLFGKKNQTSENSPVKNQSKSESTSSNMFSNKPAAFNNIFTKKSQISTPNLFNINQKNTDELNEKKSQQSVNLFGKLLSNSNNLFNPNTGSSSNLFKSNQSQKNLFSSLSPEKQSQASKKNFNLKNQIKSGQNIVSQNFLAYNIGKIQTSNKFSTKNVQNKQQSEVINNNDKNIKGDNSLFSIKGDNSLFSIKGDNSLFSIKGENSSSNIKGENSLFKNSDSAEKQTKRQIVQQKMKTQSLLTNDTQGLNKQRKVNEVQKESVQIHNMQQTEENIKKKLQILQKDIINKLKSTKITLLPVSQVIKKERKAKIVQLIKSIQNIKISKNQCKFKKDQILLDISKLEETLNNYKSKEKLQQQVQRICLLKDSQKQSDQNKLLQQKIKQNTQNQIIKIIDKQKLSKDQIHNFQLKLKEQKKRTQKKEQNMKKLKQYYSQLKQKYYKSEISLLYQTQSSIDSKDSNKDITPSSQISNKGESSFQKNIKKLQRLKEQWEKLDTEFDKLSKQFISMEGKRSSQINKSVIQISRIQI